MSEPLGLSAEQERAVRAPLGDVCVLAGAGSGKTRVLTARYVEHVVAHGLAPRRVAALTFTEKAAREMRKRIAEALERAGAHAARLEAEQAPISTLHAFCARLLRRNAVAAGLDPAFRVLDQDAALLLQAETLERVAERLAARADAADLRLALRRVAGSAPLEVLFDLLTKVRASAAEVGTLGWHEAPGGVDGARRRLAELQREATAALQAWAGRPKAALDAARQVDAVLEGRLDCAAATRALREVEIGGKGSQAPKRACKALVEGLATLAAAELDVEGREQVLPWVRKALLELERTYADLKAQRQALDFVDLERETVRLFEGLAARGRRAEGLPVALLVDEHQDTNPVQERILAAVRRHGVPQFSVGDPKQSIYRFRGADVGVLLAEQARVGADRRRELCESYRATPEVAAALNGLGERLFAGERAGVPFAALAPAGRFGPPAAGSPPPVTLALLGRGAHGVGAGRRREAAYVAAWLRRIVDGKVTRRLSKDPRPLTWNDCALLLRARSDLVLYEQGLTAAGIPFRVFRGRGYREAEEIEALRHALRVVHNPHDHFALAALLRGPALAAHDADLLRWFEPGHDPWPRLEADERPRVREVVAALRALRRQAAHADLPDVVGAVVDRLGLLGAALAQPDGLRRAANLRRAVALADDLAETGRHDLAAFLRHLELLDDLEVEQAEAPALGEDGDAVTLLTVHAAKGLEWPVVVLADAGRKPPPPKDPFLLAAGGASVALKLEDALEGEAHEPGGYQALADLAAAAAAQESLRLLYVALTRAEQHLLVTCTHQGPTSEGQPKGAEGWARDLFGALGRSLEAGVADVPVGAGAVRLVIEDAPPEVRAPVPAVGASAPLGPSEAAEVALYLERAASVPPTLGGTRYVVSVSELLTFAASPQELYRQRLVPRPVHLASGAADLHERPREPANEREPAEGLDPEGRGERAAARRRDDEPSNGSRGLDRAALGTAVHAVLERWPPGPGAGAGEALLAEALADAFPGAFPERVPPEARALAATMVERFAATDVARDLAAARASGADAWPEAAFHARIRFPDGARVAGFEHLLVRGTVDLWLPRPAAAGRAAGVWIVDHKTNPPTKAYPTPESLARHYAPQLRLYALAAERLLGQDVAGAALLLLDPGWGADALEVPVEIDGEALEETRRLCQAFAIAELEDRWPEDWRLLLP
jgi:ATP-dependent helicase/nuclease subunit A